MHSSNNGFNKNKQNHIKSEKNIQGGLSIIFSACENGISVTSPPIGTRTGSKHEDFYVY